MINLIFNVEERLMAEESLFAAALERPDPADHSAFLRQACEGDEALLRRVEALLNAHDQARELAIAGRRA